MKGKIAFAIKNRHIAFRFDLERNVTILTGDSGTGKTKLINMVRMYASEGKKSGITLNCEKPCFVLEGNHWESELSAAQGSVVFVEESTRFLTSHDFARAVQNTDNYYVFVTREPLQQIPYSVDAIKQIIKHERKPKIEKVYKNIAVKKISAFPYDELIVEDSGTGFEFFSAAVKKLKIPCKTANGKSNIINLLRKSKSDRILVIADAAALGPEIRELLRFKALSKNKIDFCLPESFEWLLLKSALFAGSREIAEILKDPVEHIESQQYFSWERYFLQLLVEESRERPQLQYPKGKTGLPDGYLTETNINHILNALR